MALQALAAVLGGTQSLHCNSRDEALALPTEASAGIALRTQQIIAAESGVTNTVDPVAGSYAIEAITTRIEREASALIERIDRLGGTLAAIESGFVQRAIQDAAYQAQQAIDRKDQLVVGVNVLTSDDAVNIDLLQVDPEVERQQVERVRQVRAGRSASEWRAAIDAVSRTASSGGNLMPPIIAAVEARATVGEISNALRAVFGEYRESVLD